MGEPRQKRPKAFFTRAEADAIVAAIGEAEKRTSGEIRLHLENRCKGGDAYERGRKVFESLGMTRTAQRNGVLIYLATSDRKFAVLGDQGIDAVAGPGFWDDVVALMTESFREDDFAGGITAAVARIGEKLASHFPHAGASDVNELPDDISFGNDPP